MRVKRQRRINPPRSQTYQVHGAAHAVNGSASINPISNGIVSRPKISRLREFFCVMAHRCIQCAVINSHKIG